MINARGGHRGLGLLFASRLTLHILAAVGTRGPQDLRAHPSRVAAAKARVSSQPRRESEGTRRPLSVHSQVVSALADHRGHQVEWYYTFWGPQSLAARGLHAGSEYAWKII